MKPNTDISVENCNGYFNEQNLNEIDLCSTQEPIFSLENNNLVDGYYNTDSFPSMKNDYLKIS